MDINQIRDVSCEDVALNLLGMESKKIGSKTSVLCPSHNDEHYGSCYVNDKYVHCFACGYHADTIALVQKINNCDFMTAVKDIAAYAGIVIDTSHDEKPKKTITFKAEELALIGINITAPLKKAYESDRKTFWEFIDACVEETERTLTIASCEEDRPQVAEIIERNDMLFREFKSKIAYMKKNDTKDSVLIIRAAEKTDTTGVK